MTCFLREMEQVYKTNKYVMMAYPSQTRIFGKVDGQFLHARWWLQSPILDVQTLLHFGQAKVWSVQAVSSAGLCNEFLEHHDHDILSEARRRRLLGVCVCLAFL